MTGLRAAFTAARTPIVKVSRENTTPGPLRNYACPGEARGKLFIDQFGMTAGGNFENRNILHRVIQTPADLVPVIEQGRELLLSMRQRRVAPSRDEKILASWNGFNDIQLHRDRSRLGWKRKLPEAAINCGKYLLDRMCADGHLNIIMLTGRLVQTDFLKIMPQSLRVSSLCTLLLER